MGFFSALDTTLGGFLPGGPTPGQVGYSETFLAPITGGWAAVASTPVALIGGGINAAITGGEINPLTTWAGAYNLGSGQGAGSIGDGPWRVSPGYTTGDYGRDVLGAVTPNFFYTPPTDAEQRQPGTQHGDWLPGAGQFFEPVKEGLWKLLLLGVAAFAFASGSKQ